MDISAYLKQHIRTVPDWPLPGIQFRDITPLLQDAAVFAELIGAFVERYRSLGDGPSGGPTVVAGMDARGFILGAVIAHQLGLGFVPVRKKGKLPFHTIEESYALEYGSATMELHTDAVGSSDRVLLVDDLIATGGTLTAGAALIRRLGAQVVECAAIVDLPELQGSERLRAQGLRVHTLVAFEGH